MSSTPNASTEPKHPLWKVTVKFGNRNRIVNVRCTDGICETDVRNHVIEQQAGCPGFRGEIIAVDPVFDSSEVTPPPAVIAQADAVGVEINKKKPKVSEV